MSFNRIEGNDLTVKTEKKFLKIELNDKPGISIIETTESQEPLEKQEEVKSKNKKGKTE